MTHRVAARLAVLGAIAAAGADAHAQAGISGMGNAAETGSTARFASPMGVAVDDADNAYVADTGNHVIRKVTPAGVVTTLAGTVGSPGSADGTGSAARFNAPEGVAVDHAGNVYVADTGNHTIRQITPAGLVTTLAGTPGSPGSADGPARAAGFRAPEGIAVDGGNPDAGIFVSDSGNNTIRRMTFANGSWTVLTLQVARANPGVPTASGAPRASTVQWVCG